MTVPTRSGRPMSDKLNTALLLQWGVPVWRLRQGGPPKILAPAARAISPADRQENRPENMSMDVFQGFFVPDQLNPEAQRLLANIVRVFPQLHPRYGFSQAEPLLQAVSGWAVVFGEPDWLQDLPPQTVNLIQLADLQQMLRAPTLKRQAYFQLLDWFHTHAVE